MLGRRGVFQLRGAGFFKARSGLAFSGEDAAGSVSRGPPASAFSFQGLQPSFEPGFAWPVSLQAPSSTRGQQQRGSCAGPTAAGSFTSFLS